MSLSLSSLKPLQSMAASVLFQKKRLMLILPRQEGKTELGVRLTHDIVSRPFTSSCLFLAKSKSSAKRASREKFLRLFDDKLFSVNSETVFLKSTPTSCCFIEHVDKDPDHIRGGTYHYIHWSEVAFSKFDLGVGARDVLDKVIAPTLRQTKGYVLLESTCNGKNGWYDLWNAAEDYGFATLRVSLSQMVEMGLIPRSEYDELRRTTHPDVFRQEYECEWIVFAGKAYPELDFGVHIQPDMPGPEEWQTTVMAIDWGYSPSATCVLFAYTKDGAVYVFDEHYKTEELAMHTADAIRAKLAFWRSQRYVATADHEQDRIDELNKRGIECGKAEKVDVLGNRVQIKEMLFDRKLFIHPRCEYLIRDLSAAVWHPKKADKGELDDTQCTWGHYDAESALRYLVREMGDHAEEKPIENPHQYGDQASAAAWQFSQMRKRELSEG